MGKTSGRFHIDHRTEVINKYVLYVEDLFVSFKDSEIKKELKIELKSLKKELKSLSNSKLNEGALSTIHKRIHKKEKQLKSKDWIHEEEKVKKQIKHHEEQLAKLESKSKSGVEDLILLERETLQKTQKYLKAISEIDYEKELKDKIEELKGEIKILQDPKLIAKRQVEIIEKIDVIKEKMTNSKLKKEYKEAKIKYMNELSELKIALDKEFENVLALSNNDKSRVKTAKHLEKLQSAYEYREDEINKELKSIKDEIDSRDPSVKRILKGVTFGLRKGETLAIVGANGAGKTVLLETILGLNVPDSYSRMVLNLGRKHYANNLKEVGIQYQQSKMGANITVRKLIADYKKLYIDRVNESLVEKMLDVFHIRPFYASKVNSLSGGQKQRLNLLLAVINNPKIMILDEFITGLDVNSVEEIINFVNDLKIKLGASMIIISHQPEEIEELADRVIVLKDGRVELETYVEDIIKEYGDVTEFIREII